MLPFYIFLYLFERARVVLLWVQKGGLGWVRRLRDLVAELSHLGFCVDVTAFAGCTLDSALLSGMRQARNEKAIVVLYCTSNSRSSSSQARRHVNEVE